MRDELIIFLLVSLLLPAFSLLLFSYPPVSARLLAPRWHRHFSGLLVVYIISPLSSVPPRITLPWPF